MRPLTEWTSDIILRTFCTDLIRHETKGYKRLKWNDVLSKTLGKLLLRQILFNSVDNFIIYGSAPGTVSKTAWTKLTALDAATVLIQIR